MIKNHSNRVYIYEEIKCWSYIEKIVHNERENEKII